MAQRLSSQTRSIYRTLLRELPSRPISSPSPLQRRIRDSFVTLSSSSSSSSSSPQQQEQHHLSLVEEAEQFAQYAKAQRVYAMLLERYNPGANMDEEEKVRLSARRVGMNLPVMHVEE
ncbi:hypothetical protein AJ80_03758 [Polytolypa hystricis UAMH7299]|uniref:Ras guanyl-nucleotide exchange factor RasGEF n=1 Tax=Polytolypa hystricis (strain UAMH7299) TaxID=1447883 RepID=A0A2B7YFM7_POLH7|nr:hypothetical protein AJ80_03758 [Polytolypa hystricis UAMH7299]